MKLKVKILDKIIHFNDGQFREVKLTHKKFEFWNFRDNLEIELQMSEAPFSSVVHLGSITREEIYGSNDLLFEGPGLNTKTTQVKLQNGYYDITEFLMPYLELEDLVE